MSQEETKPDLVARDGDAAKQGGVLNADASARGYDVADVDADEAAVRAEEEGQEADQKAQESSDRGLKRGHAAVDEAADAFGAPGNGVSEENDENDENEDEDEEDEDEEDDDEDDEDDAPAKRKRRRANQFIDIEAEVDDEEEEELDEDDEEAELLREQFIADDRVETEDGRPSRPEDHTDDRLHRQFDQRRQEAEDQDAEQLAETLKQRYRKTHSVYRGDTNASGTVSQKLLMPSINDPAIYAIRCTPGREKELVRKLFEKKRTLARGANPLDILTVFQRDAFKGYIYIEAKKPEAIERALAGMVNIYAKQRLLVPVREYPDLLKQVKSLDVELVPGIYVRVSRGKYKGDLAIVDNLSENGLDVRCKIVPRLDYGKNDDVDKDGRRVRLKVRPLPRLFSEQEARMYDGDHLQPGRGPRAYVYRGDEYVEGFLFKDLKLQYIQTKDVHPRLEELDLFQTGNDEEDGLDLAAIAASLKGEKGQVAAFQPGDKVQIRRGEQAKVVGKVVTTSLNEVTILVTDSGDPKFANQQLTVPGTDLRKVFTAGDHVKVVDGKHTDETGLVIKTDGDLVVFLSDQTRQDVRVFANYLIKATDASLNTDGASSKYELRDLVELNALTVGIIVKADRGLFGILAADGRYISVKPAAIASKVEMLRRQQVATDKNGSPVRIGDTVKEVLGEKKREGAVVHIYRNALFIRLTELLANLGIFVTSALNVTSVATKDLMVSKSLGPDLNKMNPNVKMPAPPPSFRARAGGRDKLLGKDVVINSGNHKGLMGKVVETDDVDARIELHSKSKKVKVDKNRLSVLIRGELIPYVRFVGGPQASGGPNSGPAPQRSQPAFSSGGRSSWGNATPAAGGQSTWGGASSWGGGKTPAYNAGGASSWGGNAGGASAWGGNAGGASAWGGNAGGASAWGGNSGGNAGANAGGNLAWGSGGGNSSWGGAKDANAGGSLTWDKNGKTSAWGGRNGGNSAWGTGGNSAWGSGGNLAWGK